MARHSVASRELLALVLRPPGTVLQHGRIGGRLEPLGAVRAGALRARGRLGVGRRESACAPATPSPAAGRRSASRLRHARQSAGRLLAGADRQPPSGQDARAGRSKRRACPSISQYPCLAYLPASCSRMPVSLFRSLCHSRHPEPAFAGQGLGAWPKSGAHSWQSAAVAGGFPWSGHQGRWTHDTALTDVRRRKLPRFSPGGKPTVSAPEGASVMCAALSRYSVVDGHGGDRPPASAHGLSLSDGAEDASTTAS
jgi:hypothetical protein